MPELEIRSFIDRSGRVPFQAWVDSLDRPAQAKIAIVLTRQARGNRSQVKQSALAWPS